MLRTAARKVLVISANAVQRSRDGRWRRRSEEEHVEPYGSRGSPCSRQNGGPPRNNSHSPVCSPLRSIWRKLSAPPPSQPHQSQRLTPVSLSHLGRILDLKTGTVKKEGQQSSMRMCMGSRRSFICRMRSVGDRGAVAGGGPHLLSCPRLCCSHTSGSV